MRQSTLLVYIIIQSLNEKSEKEMENSKQHEQYIVGYIRFQSLHPVLELDTALLAYLFNRPDSQQAF